MRRASKSCRGVTARTRPATLVWLAPEPPDAAQARALASWARAHGVRLVDCRRDEAPPALAVDRERAADDVERLLDRARDAIAARDARGGRPRARRRRVDAPRAPRAAAGRVAHGRGRARAVGALPAHPARWTTRRPIAPGCAPRRSTAGASPGVGEQASDRAPAPTRPSRSTLDPPAARRRGSTASRVRRRRDRHRTRDRTRSSSRGDDAPVWAELGRGARRAARRFTSTRPVAPAVLERRRRRALAPIGGAASTRAGVRCGAWVAALAGRRGRRRPRRDVRAPAGAARLLEWTRSARAGRGRRPRSTPTGGLADWATWGLVGAGAVVATGVVLVAAGAFKPAPDRDPLRRAAASRRRPNRAAAAGTNRRSRASA